jgi:hypothetical protein
VKKPENHGNNKENHGNNKENHGNNKENLEKTVITEDLPLGEDLL